MNFQRLRVITCCLFLLVLTGCVDETIDGDTHTFFIQRWIIFLFVVAGVVAPIVGWAIRKTKPWAGWGLLIAAPLFVVFLAPTLLHNKAVVTPTNFTLRVGHWFSPEDFDITFDEIQVIRFTKEEKRDGRRGRKSVSYQMVCTLKSGEAYELPIGEVLEAALPLILGTAQSKGILVYDQT